MANLTHSKLAIAISLSLSTLMAAPSSLAEQSSDASALERIEVTARKKLENLQNSPVAVSAFNQTALEIRNIKGLDDLGSFVPNVTIAPDGQAGSAASNIYIRGVGQQDYRIFTDPAVTLYVDGVLIPRAVGGLLNLLDVERVEVLKGPQGTLFGKNTVAGAITLETKQASDVFQGELEITAAERDKRSYSVKLNVPLSDSLLTKIAHTDSSSDGWGKSQAAEGAPHSFSAAPRNDQDLSASMMQIQWLGDDLEVRWLFDQTESQSHGSTRSPLTPTPSMQPVNLAGFHNYLVSALNLPLALADDSATDNRIYVSHSDFPEQARLDVWGTGLTLTSEISGVDVKSVTSYRQLENTIAIDFDAIQARLFDQSEDNQQTQFGQELQLSGSTENQRLDWLVGAFYFNEEGERSVTSQRLGALLDMGLSAVVPQLPSHFRRTTDTQLETRSIALFTQADYAASDKLDMSLGLRWSKEKKTLTGQQIYATGFADQRLQAEGVNSDTWSSVTPKFSVQYQWDNALMTYVSASKGFKSGGFNGRLNAALDNGGLVPYQPEILWTYEIGMRSEWLNNRLRFNATAFFSQYKDIQVETTKLIDGEVVNTVGNAAQAHIKGLEIDLLAKLGEKLTLDSSIGLISPEYTDIADTAVELNDDSVFPRTPERSATMGLTYTDLLGNREFNMRLDLSYQSESYSDINPFAVADINLRLASRTLFNAKIDYRLDDNWTLSLYGKNLTGKIYRVNALFDASGLGAGYLIHGAPREVGATVNYQF